MTQLVTNPPDHKISTTVLLSLRDMELGTRALCMRVKFILSHLDGAFLQPRPALPTDLHATSHTLFSLVSSGIFLFVMASFTHCPQIKVCKGTPWQLV